jgi:predicted PolB exonuclease-like 3'-5' exonuclease
MISKQILKNTLYFDIETAGLYNDFEELQDNNHRLSLLWEKRCKWLAQNSGEENKNKKPSEFWKMKASLHPEFAKVVCVSFGAFEGDEIRIQSFTGDERDILSKSNAVFNKAYQKTWKLAGHTIKNFDVPFIGKRLLINRIEPSYFIFSLNRKPWESPYLDIAEIFSFSGWGQAHTSLDLMSAVLGHESPKDSMDGSQVHEYFYTGRIEEIKNYCEKDVFTLIKCFESLSFE